MARILPLDDPDIRWLRLACLRQPRRRGEQVIMNISAMSGLAAAQSMFPAVAQAAAGVNGPSAGPGDAATTEALQVAVLQKSLDVERSLVNILA